MERYLANNRFIVCIGGVPISFAKVSNLTAGLECENISVGGMNQGVHIAPTATKQPQTITFERAVQLLDGVLLKLKPGLHLDAPVDIMIMGGPKFAIVEHCYYITDGVVTKFEVTPLDAMGNEVFVQKIEITHSGLYQEF